MSVPKLMHTKNYDLFDLHENNRERKEDRQLLESMKEYGFLHSSPIHVAHNGSNKFRVLRGHHRLECARRLKLPVYFIIDDTPIPLAKLETPHQSWNARDFAYSWASRGDADCAAILKFQDDHHLSFVMSAALVAGGTVIGSGQTRRIRAGTFKKGDMKLANEVGRIVDRCREFGIPFATERAFVSAIALCLYVPDFNPATFLHKAETMPASLRKRGRLEEYLEEIQAFYNYASRKPIALALEARRLAKERNPVCKKDS